MHAHGDWAHQQWVSTTYLTWKNLSFSCVPDRVRTRVTVTEFLVQCSTSWATPSPHSLAGKKYRVDTNPPSVKHIMYGCMQGSVSYTFCLKQWKTMSPRMLQQTRKVCCHACSARSCNNTPPYDMIVGWFLLWPWPKRHRLKIVHDKHWHSSLMMKSYGTNIIFNYTFQHLCGFKIW